MKNAKQYEGKFKKLLKGFKKIKTPEVAPANAMDELVLAILRADASDRQAEKALQALKSEYVDFNEMRVSQTKEIVECIGEDYPDAAEKAYQLTKTLNAICDMFGTLSLEPMAEMNKREIRKMLRDTGMMEFAESYISMVVFGIHAFPVDISLAGLMDVQELAPDDAEVHEIQGFLERIISQKDAYSVHMHLREYVSKNRRTAIRAMDKRIELRTIRRKEELEKRLREEQQRKLQDFPGVNIGDEIFAEEGEEETAAQEVTEETPQEGGDETAAETRKEKLSAAKTKKNEKPASKDKVKAKPKKDEKKSGKKAEKKPSKKTKKSGK